MRGVGHIPDPCARCLARHVAAMWAALEVAEESAGDEEARRLSAFQALGHAANAEHHARGLGGRSPVPAGALIAARAALERGQAAAALEAARKILRLLSHSSIEEHTP